MPEDVLAFLAHHRAQLPSRTASPRLARFVPAERCMPLPGFDPADGSWPMTAAHRKFEADLAAHASEADKRRSAVVLFDFAVWRDRTGSFHCARQILSVGVDAVLRRLSALDGPRANPFAPPGPHSGASEDCDLVSLAVGTGYLILIEAERAPLETTLDPELHPVILRARPLRLLAGAAAPPDPSSAEGPHRRAALPDLSSGMTLDGDQAAAVASVQRGENVALIGPPGCGKSTIIEALVASAPAGSRIGCISTEASARDVMRRRIGATGRSADVIVASPEEIAAQIPPEAPLDIAIVDEGARMGLAVGLTVAARSRQLVVLGDDRQLPPAAGGESLLGRALACGFTSHTLRAHYRSSTSVLIQPANFLVYDRELRSVPSPDISGPAALRLVEHPRGGAARVDGRWIAAAEADAAAEAVARSAQSGDGRSLCVITLRPAQSEAIKMRIEAEIAAGRLARADLNQRPDEPFFVRTADECQGEERDRVVVSLGLVSRGQKHLRRFGVLEGGFALQLLNVALTRARYSLEVHSSVAVEDLDRDDLSPAAFALGATLKVLRLFTRLRNEFDIDAGLASYARSLGLEVRHLGLVQALFRPGDSRYRVGVVIHRPFHGIARWDEVVGQLRSKRWNVVRTDPDRLAALGHTAASDLRDELDAALRRPPG